MRQFVAANASGGGSVAAATKWRVIRGNFPDGRFFAGRVRLQTRNPKIEEEMKADRSNGIN